MDLAIHFDSHEVQRLLKRELVGRALCTRIAALLRTRCSWEKPVQVSRGPFHLSARVTNFSAFVAEWLRPLESGWSHFSGTARFAPETVRGLFVVFLSGVSETSVEQLISPVSALPGYHSTMEVPRDWPLGRALYREALYPLFRLSAPGKATMLVLADGDEGPDQLLMRALRRLGYRDLRVEQYSPLNWEEICWLLWNLEAEATRT